MFTEKTEELKMSKRKVGLEEFYPITVETVKGGSVGAGEVCVCRGLDLEELSGGAEGWRGAAR